MIADEFWLRRAQGWASVDRPRELCANGCVWPADYGADQHGHQKSRASGAYKSLCERGPKFIETPLAVASPISARSEVMSTRIRSKIDLHRSAQSRRRLNFLIK